MADEVEMLVSSEPITSKRSTGERELPVLPLKNNVLFPLGLTPLFVGQHQSHAALDLALAADRTVLAVARRTDDHETVLHADLYSVGVEAQITRVVRLPDGTVNILLRGIRRVKIVAVVQEMPLLLARGRVLREESAESSELEAARRAVLGLFEQVSELSR